MKRANLIKNLTFLFLAATMIGFYSLALPKIADRLAKQPIRMVGLPVVHAAGSNLPLPAVARPKLLK